MVAPDVSCIALNEIVASVLRADEKRVKMVFHVGIGQRFDSALEKTDCEVVDGEPEIGITGIEDFLGSAGCAQVPEWPVLTDCIVEPVLAARFFVAERWI